MGEEIKAGRRVFLCKPKIQAGPTPGSAERSWLIRNGKVASAEGSIYASPAGFPNMLIRFGPEPAAPGRYIEPADAKSSDGWIMFLRRADAEDWCRRKEAISKISSLVAAGALEYCLDEELALIEATLGLRAGLPPAGKEDAE